MKPTPYERLQHIVKAIGRIERAVSGHTLKSFRENDLLSAAIETWLGNVSEASRHIPSDLKSAAPEINWRRLADLGNWLRHAYHSTDASLLWNMIMEDLPPLKAFTVRAMAAEEKKKR